MLTETLNLQTIEGDQRELTQEVVRALDDKIHDDDEDQTVVITSTELTDQNRARDIQQEIERIRGNINSNKTYISAATVVLSNSDESEREKLQRKIIELNGKIADRKNSVNQKQASYDSYKKRFGTLYATKEERLKNASEVIHDISRHLEEDLIPASTNVQPNETLAQLLEICNERETEIANIQKELDSYVAKDREVTSALQALQENIQEAIPRVEAEKDEVAQGILAEWELEKQNLIGVYGRLCVINREQNYHLMRGTHIKRTSQKVDKQVGTRERRLNIDNTELAKEVNGLRDKVNLTEADVRSLLVQLTHIKKLNDSERKNFQSAKGTAEERLQEANQARQEMQIENNELRNLKNELLGVIQNIRENHLSIQRSALTDSKPPIEALQRIESYNA